MTSSGGPAVGGGGPSFSDVVLAQRACRQFADGDVDDDLVERCLIVVVRDADQRTAVAELTRRVWRQAGRPASEGRLTPGLMADVDAGAETGMAGAPVLVVVCGDSSEAHRSTLPASVFPATQNLLLAAGAVGLGSAMTTLATLEADTLAHILDLPDHVHPMAVVPLGWPARPLGPPRRRPVSERAHRDRYGTPWDGAE
jgi:nitroreductase